MSRPRVLFLCTGNSCRSQMAEGFLRELAGDRYEALSAGTEPQPVNLRAVAAMASLGIDIGQQISTSVEPYIWDVPEIVITVCDQAEVKCPALPTTIRRLHWPFEDPAKATGSEAEITEVFVRVRDEIRERISQWLAEESAAAEAGEKLA